MKNLTVGAIAGWMILGFLCGLVMPSSAKCREVISINKDQAAARVRPLFNEHHNIIGIYDPDTSTGQINCLGEEPETVLLQMDFKENEDHPVIREEDGERIGKWWTDPLFPNKRIVRLGN